MKYYVERSPNGRTWEVLDAEGYSVSYVAYDTKREALDAARVREQEDGKARESAMVAAHKAGAAYWRANRPDTTQLLLEFHARTCGWTEPHEQEAWLAGFYGAQKRDTVQS